MSEADMDAWREQFQVPDAAELDGGEIPAPPARVAGHLKTDEHPLLCAVC